MTARWTGCVLPAVVGLLACDDDYPYSAVVASCVADVSSCTESEVCPTGTTCEPSSTQGNCSPDNSRERRCRAETPTVFNRYRLQEGFQVHRFEVVVDRSTSPALVRWVAPAHAQAVACAIFGCLPSFQAGSWMPPSGEETLQVISNFSSCAIAQWVESPEIGMIDLGDSRGGQDIAMASRCSGNHEKLMLSQLLVGCWVYNDADVSHASELFTLTPRDIYNFHEAIPGAGSCDDDWNTCYDDATASFGTCLGGACRARCTTASDCEAVDAPSSSGGCEWTCERQWVGHVLGACKPGPTTPTPGLVRSLSAPLDEVVAMAAALF
jgi:hypothetical protein